MTSARRFDDSLVEVLDRLSDGFLEHLGGAVSASRGQGEPQSAEALQGVVMQLPCPASALILRGREALALKL